jgi:hypothetical protein
LGLMASSNGAAPPSGAEGSRGMALAIPRLGKGDDATPPFEGHGRVSRGNSPRNVQKASFT